MAKNMCLTVLNVPSMFFRQGARVVILESLAMALKLKAEYIVVPIALKVLNLKIFEALLKLA